LGVPDENFGDICAKLLAFLLEAFYSSSNGDKLLFLKVEPPFEEMEISNSIME